MHNALPNSRFSVSIEAVVRPTQPLTNSHVWHISAIFPMVGIIEDFHQEFQDFVKRISIQNELNRKVLQ